MRDYGKVYSTFWTSDTTRPLSEDGKLLALYLMTCSHNTIAGVFRLPDGYVSEDLGWGLERVRKGFLELFAKGFANRCETTKWVWISKHLEWNKPENPNQRKSAAKIALSVPHSCRWRQAFMRASAEALAIEVPPELDGCETLEEGSDNQEQEQEQEQESSVPSGTGVVTPLPLTPTAELQLVGGKFPAPDHQPDAIWDVGLEYLVAKGSTTRSARGFLGQLRKSLDDLEVAELLAKAQELDVSEPVAWLRAAAQRRLNGGRSHTGVAL